MNYKTLAENEPIETCSPIIMTWQQTDGNAAGGMAAEDGLALKLQAGALTGKALSLPGAMRVPIKRHDTEAEAWLSVRGTEILEDSIDWEASRENNSRGSKETYIMLKNGRWAIWTMKPAEASKRLGHDVCGKRKQLMHAARGEYYMKEDVQGARLAPLPCGNKWVLRLMLKMTPLVAMSKSLRGYYCELPVTTMDINQTDKKIWSSVFVVDGRTAKEAVKNFAGGMMDGGFKRKKENGVIILTPEEAK